MSTGPAQVAVVLPNNNNNCNNSIGNKAPSVSTGSSGIGSASVVTAAVPPQPPSSSPSSSAPSTSTNTTTTTSTNWQSCPSSPTESSSPSATCHSSTNNNNNGCNMATVAAAAAASAATTTTAVSSVIASPVSPALSSSSTNAQKQELTASLATGSATAVDHPSSQVTSAAPPTSTATLADPLNRPTSLGGRQRTLGGKGKHLTRSHAMRESTSPPRTPTPRSPSDQQNNNSSSNGSPSQHQQSMLSINASSSEPPCIISSSNSHSPVLESRLFNNNNNDYGNKQTCSNSPNIVVYGGDERGGKSQLDLDFPKLTPPKSSYGPNGSNGGNNGKNSNGRNNGTNSNSKSDSDKQGKNADLVDQQKELKQQTGTLMLDCCGDQSVKAGLAVSTPAIIPNNTSSSSPVSSNNNYCDNENRNLREVNFSANSNDSNNQINIQFSHEENRYIQCESPTDSLIRNNSSSNGNLNSSAHNNKKHRGAGGNGGGGVGAGGGGGGGGNGIPVTGKGNKPRLKNMSGGSSSSMDGGGGSIGSGGCGGGMGGGGGGSSSFLSRDNSCEQFTDQSGVNLIQFFKETLNKNFKDRNMLMKIEKELLALAMDRTRSQIKFPPMSSYNRMLIHRVAAYFGMEHNVDATQQSVIAEVTSATRIPEIRFKTLINESFSEEPRKSILKRDTHSFDEYRYGLLHCPDRGILDRKAKSFEEREEEYDKVKRRIFKNREDGSSEEHWQWMSTDNPEPPNGRPKLQNNRLLKVQSVSIEGRSDERPCVSKSHSFGGYGGSSQNAPLLRGDSITSTKSASGRLFTKQDSNASTNTPWRLSPSSSGSYFTFSYKTQSIRSDSVTPSPTGYGSGDHTPEPCIQSPSSTCGVVWAVTDMASVPKGSVLIDPQTLQPIVNQDGSIYHFDPSNLPATANLPGSVPRVQKKKFEKQKSFSSRNNLNSSSSLESSIDLPLGNKNDCGQQTTINNNATTTIAEEIGSELIYDGSTSTIKITTKDSHDIDDSSLCEEISQTTNELGTLKLQKHQATSPMLQASELQPLELNEIQLNANHEHEHGALSEVVTPLVGDPETGVGTLMVVAVNSDTSSVKHDNQPEHQQHGLASDDANDANSEHSQEADKKDETGGKMNAVQTVPLVSYSNSATPNSAYTVNYENGSGTPGGAGTTVYASGAPGMSTTYQTAPDGTIYAVPSPLVYTYPSAMDPEMSGYFVPVYDQQRDPSMCTAAGTPVYQAAAAAAGAASTVLPIAYTPTAAYSGTPLYQNPTAVMYSSEQFPTAAQATAAAAAAASAGPLPQYPIGYPIGIGYPFNSTAYQNYWNQPITYYVPQTPVPSAGSTPIIMPPPQTPTNSSMMSATSMHGKRNTTPPNHGQQSQNQGQSASVTPVPISPFATNIPMPLPDPNAGPMYAIPQPIYSNMLPFTGPMTPHPHHPSAGAGGGGTIVNSVLPTATAAAAIGYHHHPHSQSNQSTNMDSLPSSNGSASNIYSNPSQNNNAQTPQSTPSTPLSLPLSLPPHGKNPPLFATPPILPNGYNPQMGSASGGGSGAGAGHHHYNPSHSYEDRKSSGSSGGYQGKRSNANSGNYFNYSNNNNSRQMTPNSVGGGGSGASNYQNQGNSGTNGGPKSYTNSNNTGNNQNSNTGGPLMLGQPPKGRSEGQTTVTKPPLIPTLPNNNNNSTSSNTNPSDKTRINRSSKPPNLDLKRSYNNNFNVNSRNTPSTNSTESNNSPNSITSSSVHEHHPSQHHHHHHPQSQSHHPFGHGTSGSAAGSHHAYYPPQQQQHQQQQPAYYHHSQQRGGSVGSNNGGGGGVGGGANVNASAGGAAGMSSSATIQSAAAVAAAACAAAAIEPYHHSQLIPLNATGMSYVKIGQTYFTHPSLALPPSRRSPPNDIRPIAGVYPAMNMVMPASRQFTPRPQHSGGYKGNKAPR